MIKNYESKQYTWALFIGHLVLEKLLKGIYAKLHEDKPYLPKIHNLNILAEKCELQLDEKQTEILFNSVVLFGAYAKNCATKNSNLDFIIDTRENLNGFKLYSLITKIEEAFNKD